MMRPGGRRQAARGLVGTIVLILVVLTAFKLNELPVINSSDSITIEFAEAGGLRGGDAVMVSGAQVGKVRQVRLRGDRVVAEVAITDGQVRLGRTTGARIVTMTLLGRAGVALDPSGTGDLRNGGTIPLTRTSAPYNLTSTLDQLAETTAAIDKDQLSEALEQATDVFNSTSADVGPALDGLTTLAAAVADNDDELRSLLASASRVTGVLASRDAQVESLLVSGRSLLAEVAARQGVVVSLLQNAKSLSTQLRLTLDETDAVLGPALKELDQLVALLNRNRRDLQATITGLQGYVTAYGEAVSSGPWFDVYLQNLLAPTTLAPFLSGVN